MQLPALLEQALRAPRWRSRYFLFFAGVVLLATLVVIHSASVAQVQIQGFGRWPPGEQDSLAGVYLPSDRAISRALERARERLADGEYHEALAFLHGLLGREEDWFLERVDAADGQRGVKVTARRLIGGLPPAGQEAYELLHGAAARRQFDAALKSGDRNGVAAVVRQFFHTKAGYEAALVLAQMEADQGHRLAAGQIYRELLDSPRAAQQFEPQLSLLAALNQLAAGEREAAADVMRSLIERHPNVQLSIAGKTELAPGVGADQVAWLLEFVGEPASANVNEQNWMAARGGASRNVDMPGGQPHLRARWQARYISEPSMESYLTARNDEFTQRGVVVVPMARPIAVGDIAVMRTPENIVAVDWQSGKRIWETREDGDLQTDESSTEFMGDMEREQWAAQGNPLEERMWDDALAMSLSSDGQRVFLLRGMTGADVQQAMAWAIGPNFGPMAADGTAATNQLAAYDIATQGKLVWELDGSRAAPPLDGAFFLGAPLAIDNTLYVMAEIRSAIYLLALNPANGELLWQQQLLGLEQSIALDPLRRRNGAMPSYSAGIMVCPTSAGAVIAIDVVKREFAWVYRYSREPQSPAEFRNNMWQNAGQTPIVRANDRWLDSAAVIDGGHVIVTPVESSEVHCVDLRTGKLSWKRRQGDSLFVGCVDEGNILLVGPESVQALRVEDGASAWPQEAVPLPAGALAAGHGYLSEGNYYLPLTSGDIAAIKLKSGRITIYPAPKPGTKLGNLICHRGSVLSQSSLMLDKFEQLEVLKNRTELALAGNPDDPTAIRELAELRKTEGRAAESVGLLKQAYKLAPDDALTQEMLAEALLEALANDYDSFRYDVPLVDRLVRDRAQRIELMRIEARGLEKLGQRLQAFDAYLRLADFTAEEPVELRVSSNHAARTDAWVCGRLGTLWRDASDEERAEIRKRVESRQPGLENPRTAAELRHYLAHMDQLPGSDDVRVALTNFLISRDRVQEAEIEVLKLAWSPDKKHRTVADELSATLAKKFEKAATPSRSRGWPAGQVKAESFPATANIENESRGNRGAPEKMAGYRQLRIEQESPSDSASPIQWYVAMDCSEIVGRNPLGDDVVHIPVEQNGIKPYRDSSLAHAAQLGRMLYVAIGGRIMAINSPGGAAEGAPDLMWQTDPMSRYAVTAQPSRRAIGDNISRANRRPVYHSWSPRKRMIGSLGSGVYALGPVTPRGIVYQEGDLLKCVDPLNGDVFWTRSDIPAGCELFGDSEYVCAADASARIAYVIRVVDGRLIGKRELPKYEWLLTAGRNVAEIGFEMNGENRALVIRVSDIVGQETIYEHKFALASRITVVEPSGICVFEPTGKFQLIDVRSGETLIDRELEALPDANGIHAMSAGDQLFLFVSSPPNQQYKSLVQQSDFPLINGRVYAFNLTSGESTWAQPAMVRSRGIVLAQPRDVPFLVFAYRKRVRDAKTGGGSQLRLLCIDKRNGYTVYSNDGLADTSITRFRIRGEQEGESAVAIEMSASRIVLTLTDDPVTAQTPTNDDAPKESDDEKGGLGGLGRRITGALQDALQKSSERQESTAPDEPDDD
jgi:outer membrane protein assembly factor BamB